MIFSNIYFLVLFLQSKVNAHVFNTVLLIFEKQATYASKTARVTDQVHIYLYTLRVFKYRFA